MSFRGGHKINTEGSHHVWNCTGNRTFRCSKCGIEKISPFQSGGKATYYRDNVLVKNEGCKS